MKTHQRKNKKMLGFSMAEMLISIGLFTVVMSATSSAFLIGIRTQRQVIASLNANDNISYAMEVMARDIRTGKSFTPADTEDSLSFTNYKNEMVTYFIDNDALSRTVGSAPAEPLTSSNVRVLKAIFHVTGQRLYDDEQVRITVLLTVASKYGGQEIITNLETSISPRSLEI